MINEVINASWNKNAPSHNLHNNYLSALPKQNRDIILPRQILLIEDDDEFAEIAANSIRYNTDSEVTVAYDPFHAGDIISEKTFDLVITDWNLPVLNGFSTLRRVNQYLDQNPLTQDFWFEKKIPVIVLTVCDKSLIEQEKKLKGRFKYLGFVSKGQPLNTILEEISALYKSEYENRINGPKETIHESGIPF